MTKDEAIDVMARWLINAHLIQDTEDWWSDYPEIGEYDWDTIMLRVKAHVIEPDDAEWKEAYALLESRADHV